MKKTYISPKVIVECIDIDTVILAGSPTTGTTDLTGGGATGPSGGSSTGKVEDTTGDNAETARKWFGGVFNEMDDDF